MNDALSKQLAGAKKSGQIQTERRNARIIEYNKARNKGNGRPNRA